MEEAPLGLSLEGNLLAYPPLSPNLRSLTVSLSGHSGKQSPGSGWVGEAAWHGWVPTKRKGVPEDLRRCTKIVSPHTGLILASRSPEQGRGLATLEPRVRGQIALLL